MPVALPAADSTVLPQQILPDVQYSKDSLDASVTYSGDFERMDIASKRVLLLGNAKVAYKDIILEADSIVFDFNTNEVLAASRRDSVGEWSALPKFTEKDEYFVAERIRYNFKSQKGKIYDVRTQQNELFIVGGAVRYESKAARRDSTSLANDVAFSENALITTCDYEHPHFGIRSKKIKVIPDKLAVIGPSNLEIGGISLPIGLPFGFFPITKGQRQGVLFPRNYEFSPIWGFGLRNLGYYIPLGEHFDMKVQGDIYTRGTWRVGAVSNYVKRYKYNGGFNLEYSNLVRDIANSAEQSKTGTLSLKWDHKQDQRAHPSQNFGGSINFQTNNAQRLNYNDANSVLNNQIRSNMTYSKNFIGTPFNLTAAMSHSQLNSTHEVSVELPTVNLTMRQIYPFKPKTPSAKPKWYENVGVTYALNALSKVSTTDSTFFTKETLDKIEYGAKHTISVNAPFTLLKYFNFTPSAAYSEKWFFKSVEKYFDPTPEVTIDSTGVRDTTAYGQVRDRRINGFAPLRELTQLGVSMGTQLYGTMQFKRGWLRGLRHLAKPSVGFNFTPDYTTAAWGYFKTLEQTDTRPEYNDTLTYSRFSNNNIYGQPSTTGKVMSLNFGLTNLFEAKYFSKRDTLAPLKKITLSNLSIGASYNMAADTLRWSQINLNGTTSLLKNMSTITYRMILDPYAALYNAKGGSQRINQTQWSSKRQPLRFERFDLGINTNISTNAILQWLGIKTADQNQATTSSSRRNSSNNSSKSASLGNLSANNDNNDYYDGNEGGNSAFISDLRINYQFNVTIRPLSNGKTKTEVTTNNIRLSGTINLSDKWKIGAGSISYDFKSKRLVYPDLSFYRDLHCWEMGMSWQPERGTYAFFLRVKPSALDFLNIPYNKNNYDAYFGR